MQRMLKMSRFYTLAEILGKILLKKGRKIGDLIYELSIWCQLNLYYTMLCDYCLRDLHLYIWKMLTDREMVNFQKWDFFRFFYTITINCVTTGTRKMPLEYMFCFICKEQCQKSIRHQISVACLVLYSRKLFLITLPLTFF